MRDCNEALSKIKCQGTVRVLGKYYQITTKKETYCMYVSEANNNKNSQISYYFPKVLRIKS